MNNVHVETDKSFVDMTVQEKHITVSTDAKLTKKIISRGLKINTQLSLPLRRSHKREKKGLSHDQRFSNYPKVWRPAEAVPVRDFCGSTNFKPFNQQ